MPIDEPFEYLSFGGTFSRSFQIWLDRFDFFGSIAGIALIPFVILEVSLAVLLAVWIIEEEEIPDFEPKHIPLVILVFGLQFLTYEFATILGRAAIIRGVAKMYVGQSVLVSECLREAWAKKGTLISVAMIVGLGFSLAIAVLVVSIQLAIMYRNPFTIIVAVFMGIAIGAAGFYGYIGVVLTNPSIMVENLSGPMLGIKRSWELASGSRCYLLCVLFCLWFLNYMVSRMLHNIFVSGDIMDVVFSLAGLVVNILPLLIYFPLHSIVEVVMYLNLRIGRESMNHQVLSGDLSNDGSVNLARFRNDDFSAPSTAMTDYRHVPLMDQEDVPTVGFALNEMA